MSFFYATLHLTPLNLPVQLRFSSSERSPVPLLGCLAARLLGEEHGPGRKKASHSLARREAEAALNPQSPVRC